ncbi:MAG: DUF4149 domain-containing protein, partial [Burkholderiales bacterium]|nr:DUF4149 domain-containing protein [Burkholderiales bacterium]
MLVANQQAQQRLHKLRLLIAALWVGNIVTVGYMVAPTLFATLYDRVLAGTIAGSMFGVQFWLTLGCGGLLFGLVQGIAPAQRKILRLLVGSILLCAVISHLGLQPMMAAIKAEAGGVLAGA